MSEVTVFVPATAVSAAAGAASAGVTATAGAVAASAAAVAAGAAFAAGGAAAAAGGVGAGAGGAAALVWKSADLAIRGAAAAGEALGSAIAEHIERERQALREEAERAHARRADQARRATRATEALHALLAQAIPAESLDRIECSAALCGCAHRLALLPAAGRGSFEERQRSLEARLAAPRASLAGLRAELLRFDSELALADREHRAAVVKRKDPDALLAAIAALRERMQADAAAALPTAREAVGRMLAALDGLEGSAKRGAGTAYVLQQVETLGDQLEETVRGAIRTERARSAAAERLREDVAVTRGTIAALLAGAASGEAKGEARRIGEDLDQLLEAARGREVPDAGPLRDAGVALALREAEREGRLCAAKQLFLEVISEMGYDVRPIESDPSRPSALCKISEDFGDLYEVQEDGSIRAELVRLRTPANPNARQPSETERAALEKTACEQHDRLAESLEQRVGRRKLQTRRKRAPGALRVVDVPQAAPKRAEQQAPRARKQP